ncbi:MAG TPA: NlpC/P60 family protein [Thermoleophilaceae bacterium]
MARDSGASDLAARLLADPAFRAAFRAEPERALREAGFTELAGRVGSAGPAKALETLEIRESRSSLAGAMMAVALEGVGLVGADQALAHASARPASLASADAPAAPSPASALGPDAPAAQSPASALGADDIVEIAQERKVAANAAAESEAAVESDGPDGGDADHGDGSGEEPAGDENERDEDESEEDESDSGDDGSDDDSDAPGEGSNGEDANDSASDGDSDSGDGDSDSGDGPGSSEDDQDASGDGSDSSDDSDDDDDSGSDDDDSGSDDGSGSSGDDSADGDSGGDALGRIAPGDYPGDDASKPELARWMAGAAQKRGLPPELPLMAALTESGLQNLDHGDRDSVGFFQMRLGTWNKDEYAGYPDDPDKQLDWFLDQAAAVKAQRASRGQSVTDPNQYGEWIADIERPAAEYRGRYQLKYAEAHALIESAAAQKPSNAGAGAELIDVTVGGRHAGSRALEAVALAKRQMGVPYQWGGSSPSGFDCSGLVQWVYAKVGVRIPRVTDQQILASNGTAVDRNHLLPGDLVFFRNSTGYVHHVGISLGGDKFINAPHTGAKVRIDNLNDPYWAKEFTGGRRFDQAVGAEVQARAAVSAPPRVDERAVQIAQTALDRDAAEVGTPGTALFQALERQERGKNDQVQFLPAVSRTP